MHKTEQYNQIINNYYGANTKHRPKKQRRAKSFMSTVFDNGEILVQKPVTESGPNAFEEYLVFASSHEDSGKENTGNEEYIVYQASHETNPDNAPFQEYVINQSLSHDEHISDMFSESGSSFRDEIANLKDQYQNNALDQVRNNSNSQAGTNNPQANPDQTENTNPPADKTNRTTSEIANAALNNASNQSPQTTASSQSLNSEMPMSEEEDLLSAMKSILNGEKSFDENSRQLVDNKSAPQNYAEQEVKLPKSSEHKIFDALAQSMSYANAYDM